MNAKSPEFLYIGFILPSLFALTLVGEGLYKISKDENGFFTFFLGTLFLVGIIAGYLLLFFK